MRRFYISAVFSQYRFQWLACNVPLLNHTKLVLFHSSRGSAKSNQIASNPLLIEANRKAPLCDSCNVSVIRDQVLDILLVVAQNLIASKPLLFEAKRKHDCVTAAMFHLSETKFFSFSWYAQIKSLQSLYYYLKRNASKIRFQCRIQYRIQYRIQ